MQHDRHVAGTVLPDVFGAEPTWRIEIDLQRAALPVAADGVAQHELQLWAVKRALPRVHLVLDARRGASFLQRALSLIPYLVRADPVVRTIGQLDPERFKAEIAIDRA